MIWHDLSWPINPVFLCSLSACSLFGPGCKGVQNCRERLSPLTQRLSISASPRSSPPLITRLRALIQATLHHLKLQSWTLEPPIRLSWTGSWLWISQPVKRFIYNPLNCFIFFYGIFVFLDSMYVHLDWWNWWRYQSQDQDCEFCAQISLG